MANYLVDTNVILRFLLADDERQSPIAKSYFVDTTNQLWITTIVFCEVVWVMKKRAKIPNDKIALLLNSLVASGNVIYDKTDFDNGMKFLTNGGDFADGVIAHQVQQRYQHFDNLMFITFDKNASKLANHFNLNYRLL